MFVEVRSWELSIHFCPNYVHLHQVQFWFPSPRICQSPNVQYSSNPTLVSQSDRTTFNVLWMSLYTCTINVANKSVVVDDTGDGQLVGCAIVKTDERGLDSVHYHGTPMARMDSLGWPISTITLAMPCYTLHYVLRIVNRVIVMFDIFSQPTLTTDGRFLFHSRNGCPATSPPRYQPHGS